MNLGSRIRETILFLEKNYGAFNPIMALQLGTGMSTLQQIMTVVHRIPYHHIPNLKSSTAPSHKGELLMGDIEGKPCWLFSGRYHYYEGYSMEEVVFPVYLAKYAGVHHMLITNASGSVNDLMKSGDLVCIKDHINLIGANPPQRRKR